MMLNIVRKIDKFMGCHTTEGLQKRCKDKRVYNYLDVPEQCFRLRKSNNNLVEY